MSKNHVLIVGGSSNIGCEIIRQMAGEDSLFLAHYHCGGARLVALQDEVSAKIVPIQADLSTESGVDSLIEAVVSRCDFPGKIVFVAAPDLVLTRFKDLAWDDFKAQMDMQLFTAFKVLSRFLPEMSKAGEGRVVFILSSYTQGTPPSAMAHYVTAKYALLGLMKSLSSEYAGKKICINSVSPSMIETDYLATIPGKIIEFTAQQHPQKRNGRPSDIAPVVKFLLSDEATFVTGVNIPVTGGA